MRFIDEATISVSAGHGGPGCVSFRRETFAPRGGPDGGDGGAGGDVWFIASAQISTLQDLRFKREYKAGSGNHGSGANKAGRDGEDVFVTVPVGTVLKDPESGEVLYDFLKDKEKWLACEGGRGGKGNAHFVSSTHQAPRFAQPGELGQFRDIKVELKLLADAAIIGYPNAGKSTFISKASAARPKIADYAFTTLTPNLGVVQLSDHRSFVVADIPGLIEGAHAGLGLGHKFLKHIERTRVFLHLLDGMQILEDLTLPSEKRKELQELSPVDYAVENILKRYKSIREELGLFNADLLKKPEIVAINKMDLLSNEEELIEKATQTLNLLIKSENRDYFSETFLISGATQLNIPEILETLYKEVMNSKRREVLAGKETAKQTLLPDDIQLNPYYSNS